MRAAPAALLPALAGVLVALLTAAAPQADEGSLREARRALYQALDSRNTDDPAWERAAAILAPLLAAGDPGAKFYASYLYAYGRGGFPRDPQQADRLREEAARDGYVEAMIAQARRLELGLGEPRDLPASVRWYEKAAAEGSWLAAERLRRAHAAGELGLASDAAAAERWRLIRDSLEAPRERR